MTIAAIAQYARQLDVPQLAHLLSAALCFYFGRKSAPPERLILWSVCACMYAGLGYAGFLWGSNELPTSYRVWGPEASVFRPLPGIVELRGVDHAAQCLLGALFAASALVCAWADGLVAALAAVVSHRVRALTVWPHPHATPTHPAH